MPEDYFRSDIPPGLLNLPKELADQWQNELIKSGTSKDILSICTWSKKAKKKLKICKVTFWKNLIQRDHPEYYYIYNRTGQSNKTLADYVKLYVHLRDSYYFLKDIEQGVPVDIDRTEQTYFTTDDPFLTGPLTLLYLAMQLQFKKQDKAHLWKVYNNYFRFELPEEYTDEMLPYWYALLGLYSIKNNDKLVFDMLTKDEDFLDPRTFSAIDELSKQGDLGNYKDQLKATTRNL